MTFDKEPQVDGHSILSAKEGGQESVARLLEIYRPWLQRLAENAIDSWLKPRLAASDVVQGSILLALSAFSEFRGQTEAELRSWLRAIFANHLIDRQRQLLAKKRHRDSEAAGHEAELIDEVTPSQIIASEEEAGRLIEAIGQLDEHQRAIVQLRYLHDLSFEGIAQELGLSRHAVSRRWVQAIQVLARLLK